MEVEGALHALATENAGISNAVRVVQSIWIFFNLFVLCTLNWKKKIEKIHHYKVQKKKKKSEIETNTI